MSSKNREQRRAEANAAADAAKKKTDEAAPPAVEAEALPSGITLADGQEPASDAPEPSVDLGKVEASAVETPLTDGDLAEAELAAKAAGADTVIGVDFGSAPDTSAVFTQPTKALAVHEKPEGLPLAYGKAPDPEKDPAAAGVTDKVKELSETGIDEISVTGNSFANPPPQDSTATESNDPDPAPPVASGPAAPSEPLYHDPEQVVAPEPESNEGLGWYRADQALEAGKRVARKADLETGFWLFRRPAATLNPEIIANVNTLPEPVKKALLDLHRPVSFSSYLVALNAYGDIINGWKLTQDDLDANDWVILD